MPTSREALEHIGRRVSSFRRARSVRMLAERAHAVYGAPMAIPEFTGVSSPYEPPEHPELAIHTGECAVEDCLSELMAYVEREFMAER